MVGLDQNGERLRKAIQYPSGSWVKGSAMIHEGTVKVLFELENV